MIMLVKAIHSRDIAMITRLSGHLLVYCMVFAVFVCSFHRMKQIQDSYHETMQITSDSPTTLWIFPSQLFGKEWSHIQEKMVTFVTDYISTFAKEVADQAARECFQQSDNLFLQAVETSVLSQPIGSCIVRNTQYILTKNMAYLDNRIANDMDQMYRLFFLVKWGTYIGYANTAGLIYSIRTRNNL